MLEALYTQFTLMKKPHAVALGRRGGQKGGPAGERDRAKAFSARRRAEIARAAARARWGALPERLRALFPGYHFEDIPHPDPIDFVMVHVLARGGEQDKRWLALATGSSSDPSSLQARSIHCRAPFGCATTRPRLRRICAHSAPARAGS